MWDKGGKVIKVPFAVGTKCVYLKPFANGARWVPFAVGTKTICCTTQAYKAHASDHGKGLIKEYYYQWS